jgi:anti-sigma regulatory factor (Ser/Thr protein kinase)
MQAHQNGSANGTTASLEQPASASRELDDLRATCRRQAHVIDTLTGAVVTLRSGATALKAHNAELRADNDRLHGRHRGPAKTSAAPTPVELRLALDLQAPAAARAAVTSALRDRVPAAMLGCATLVISEIATNSVLHSGTAPAGELILRIRLSDTTVRLEVEDGGSGEVVARKPDVNGGGGGFGLNLVHTLSERWGVEHAVAGGTRVWAQLGLKPLTGVHAAA